MNQKDDDRPMGSHAVRRRNPLASAGAGHASTDGEGDKSVESIAQVDKVSHLTWTNLPAEAVLPGVARQVVHGVRQSIVRYVYAPGAVFPRHVHPQEQMTLVIRGRIAFDVEGQEFELGPGDIARIPGGIAHGARVVGEEEVETFNSLSPRREQGPGEVDSETLAPV